MAADDILVFNSIQELYGHLGLPVTGLDDKADFAVHNLHSVHSELPYASPVFRANYFSFLFVKNGRGAYTTDEQRFITEPGAVYFTNPGHLKSFDWHELEDACIITLNESFLKENVHARIFEEFPFLLAEIVPPRVLPPAVFSEFELLCGQVLKEYAASSYRNRVIGSLFMVMLLKIKEYCWNDYNPIYEGDRSSEIVRHFKLMLEKHFRELCKGTAERVYRVQDYADAQHLHPNYLSNVIKSKTGKSIGTWTAEKTIAEARSLLQHSAVSVKEIGYRLGFAESAHFSNYFKKHTGQSPVVYRKQHHAARS